MRVSRLKYPKQHTYVCMQTTSLTYVFACQLAQLDAVVVFHVYSMMDMCNIRRVLAEHGTFSRKALPTLQVCFSHALFAELIFAWIYTHKFDCIRVHLYRIR